MKRYEVKVEVTYKVDALSEEDAFKKIDEGAEFPVVPYDDNTYCSDIFIAHVKEVSNADVSSTSNDRLF